MKFGIIGTINCDSITFPDGKKKEGWGGMLYNIVALQYLSKKGDEIFPVCNVGRDCYRPIFSILNRLPNVCADYVNKVKGRNNHCFLTYTDKENKSEILKGGVPRLNYADIEPLLNCDIVLMNYISGRDVYLKSLQKFRRHFKGILYIDIHSLTLGKRADGARYLRIPPDWISVTAWADYIQMNRLELGLLSQTDITGNIRKSLEMLVGILRRNNVIMEKKVLVVTDGGNGCHLYRKAGNAMEYEKIHPRSVKKKGNTTGCGDAFSAGFISGLARFESLTDCAITANRAAVERIDDRRNIYSIMEAKV